MTILLLYPAGSFDSSHTAHHDVHQDNVRPERRENIDGFLAARDRTDNLNVRGFFQKGGEAIAQQPVIIDNKHFYIRHRIHQSCRFNVTVKSVPSPGLLATASSPPKVSTAFLTIGRPRPVPLIAAALAPR